MPPCYVNTLRIMELPNICLILLKSPTLPRWFYSKIRDARTLFTGRISRDMVCIFTSIYIREMFSVTKHVQYWLHKSLQTIFFLCPDPPCSSPLSIQVTPLLGFLIVTIAIVSRSFFSFSKRVHKSIQPQTNIILTISLSLCLKRLSLLLTYYYQ